MRHAGLTIVAVLVLFGVHSSAIAFSNGRPNVLFIVVDDLNDWVGCLGGHPQASTPNIDRLAARGMLFTNAHCTASLCNPSRASVMTGTLPSTNGVHGNQQDWRQSPYLANHLTLPEYFRRHGYWTGASGKIFHANHGAECGALNGGHGGLRGFHHPPSWTERHPSHEQQLARLAVPTGRNFNGLDIWHWDWGPIEVPIGDTADGKATHWTVAALKQADEPFFLAIGLYAPHGPWYCPPKYFDEHPLDQVRLPELNPMDDVDDLPDIAKRYLRNPSSNLHQQILQNKLYPQAVQAYLAQIRFADEMLGRVLDQLENHPAAENTIVVLWSDHGWHLGEKQKWHKGTNWEEGTRVPLIISAPGVTSEGEKCAEPVSLVDLFPTLLDLCGLPAYERLDGHSLRPQLVDPSQPTNRPAYTINNGRHQSVRSRRWRYIRYSDGSEELYDHQSDPAEYRNLANQTRYENVKRRLATSFPAQIRRVDGDNVVRFGPDGQPTDLPEEPGFRPIFNGYDLTTWKGDPNLWRVEEDRIIGETTTRATLPANTFLIWEGSRPDDFELRLRVRVFGDNNSGVQYRSEMVPDRGRWVVRGYQLDLHPGRDALGMVYEEQGRRVIARRAQRVVVSTDSRKLLVEKINGVDTSLPHDLSAWHDVAIVAIGNHLTHRIDDQTVAEVWDHDSDARRLKGRIALQLHRGKPMRVEFKDVRIKDLSTGRILRPDETPVPDDAVEVNSPRRR